MQGTAGKQCNIIPVRMNSPVKYEGQWLTIQLNVTFSGYQSSVT